jgi:hypothetical protein
MKTLQVSASGILILIWMAGLLYALGVTLHFSDYIPNKFLDLINRVIEMYAPQLSIMFAFIFARRKAKKTSANQPKISAVLAVTVSLIYVGLFSWLMLKFATQHLQAVDLLSIIDHVQPKTTFLVSGMLAYYFGTSA